MSDMITRAENMLLAPAELTLAQVQRQIASAAHGLDWLDMYFQVSTSEGWRLEDGEVKTGHYSADSGVGLRALRGETTACASSDIIAPQTIADIRRVAQVAKTHGGHLALGDIAPPVNAPPRFVDINPVEATADVEKIALLQKIDTIARAADARVENVIAS
ncbi:MAG: PmbA/TldA family metallopeptidase, partial [Gammaproteobacteria bacterium]